MRTILGVFLFFLALTANVWLWGHWSFDKSAGLTGLLALNSLLLLFLIIYPFLLLTKKVHPKNLLNRWSIRGPFLLTIVLTIILSVVSFYGLIVYILPIKVLLLGVYVFFIAKQKKWLK